LEKEKDRKCFLSDFSFLFFQIGSGTDDDARLILAVTPFNSPRQLLANAAIADSREVRQPANP
jgi:hypothetical protein